MQLLISPTNLGEAKLVADAGCPIVDIKNVDEGSLGAQPVSVIRQVIAAVGSSDARVSVAIGDLPCLPGTVSLAAHGAATLGPDFIKAGLRGATGAVDARAMIQAMVQSVHDVDQRIITVASGYADFKRFDGLHWQDLLEAASKTSVNVVMLDTLIKDGQTLFDAMSMSDLHRFTDMAHDAGLKVALAGSISMEHLDRLCEINPDILGMRGGVCHQSDRTQGICSQRLTQLINTLQHQPTVHTGV